MSHEEEEDSTSMAKTKRSEEDDLAKRGNNNDDEYSMKERTSQEQSKTTTSKRMKLVVEDNESGGGVEGSTTTTTTTTTDRNSSSSSSTGTGGNNTAVAAVSPLPPAPIEWLVLDRFLTSSAAAGSGEDLDRNIAMMRSFVPPPTGTRLAVHWDILLNVEDQEDEDAVVGAALPLSPAKQKTVTSRWWKATLLPHDGRQMLVSLSGNQDQARTTPTTSDDNNNNNNNDDVVLADVRVLEYDAMPELGYDTPSRENVIFYGPNFLIQCNGATNADHDDGDHQEKEEEKDNAPPVDITLLEYKIWSNNDDAEEEDNDMDAEAAAMIDPAETYVVCRRNSTDIEDLVNETLTASLQKVMDRFQLLPASEQLQLAERIGIKKQRLVTLLRDHVEQHGVVSEQDMRTLLTQAMAE
jgi:hypothetical protein